MGASLRAAFERKPKNTGSDFPCNHNRTKNIGIVRVKAVQRFRFDRYFAKINLGKSALVKMMCLGVIRSK